VENSKHSEIFSIVNDTRKEEQDDVQDEDEQEETSRIVTPEEESDESVSIDEETQPPKELREQMQVYQKERTGYMYDIASEIDQENILPEGSKRERKQRVRGDFAMAVTVNIGAGEALEDNCWKDAMDTEMQSQGHGR